MLNPKTGKEIRVHVEKKLIIRLRIFFFLIFILFDIIIYEISMGYISPVLSLFGAVCGFGSALVFVRRKRIYWEEETSKVIAKMDQIGILILVIYIAFIITRHWLLHQWLHGNQVTAFTLSFAAGGMAGRVWSIRRQIRKVLKSRQII